MREHDQPRRHARSRAWPGLILAALIALALASAALAQGQDDAGAAATCRPDRTGCPPRSGMGSRTASGGLSSPARPPCSREPRAPRRRGRHPDHRDPDETGKGFQADIYAEGEVRVTGQEAAPRADGRDGAANAKSR